MANTEIEFRTVKRKQDKKWVDVEFAELQPGDKFRMWEPDGTIIRVNNKYVFTASSVPYNTENKNGLQTLGIECEE